MILTKHIIPKALAVSLLLLFSICFQDKVHAVQGGDEILYAKAFEEMKHMLHDSIPLDFKRAVFLTEDAYLGGVFDYAQFCGVIEYYGFLINSFMQVNQLDYNSPDYDNVARNSAIFYFMTDTIFLSEDTVLHYPYTYNFDDFDGSKDWSNMFVIKLFDTGEGNCHSMPYLYKILADQIGAKAYLSLAPYHMYIKTYSEKSGWFNTELTSAMFPVDAWISASGYVQLEAIRNGVYMDTLSQKQSIALCLFDLAKGYEKKYGFQKTTFIIECLDLALAYYPNYVNAMVYKAEILKRRLNAHMYLNGTEDFKDVLHLEMPKQIYDEMELLYAQILKLGYREMPPEMYSEWYLSLKNGGDRFQNKNILHIFQNQ